MLACYVQYELAKRLTRCCSATTRQSPPPTRSRPPDAPPQANAKAGSARTADGQVAHSPKDLIAELGTLTRNTVRVTTIDATYQQLTTPTELQKRAFELLGLKLAWPSSHQPKTAKHQNTKFCRQKRCQPAKTSAWRPRAGEHLWPVPGATWGPPQPSILGKQGAGLGKRTQKGPGSMRITDEMLKRALDACDRDSGEMGPVRMRAALEAAFAGLEDERPSADVKVPTLGLSTRVVRSVARYDIETELEQMGWLR
jgi:hypothetical protein